MEIAPQIHWIDRVRSNTYACLDDDGVTLIDTGLPGIDRMDLIFNYLERLKKYPADLRRILITHADADHAGNALEIWRETGAEIYASADTRLSMAAGRSPVRGHRRLVDWFTGLIRYPAVPQEQVRILDATNRALPVAGGLEVIPTPGHTAGHLAYYSQRTGVLFAGDALNTRRGRLQCTPEIIAADRRLAYRSAVHLLQFNPAVFACGHGKPMSQHSVDTLLSLQEKWLIAQI